MEGNKGDNAPLEGGNAQTQLNDADLTTLSSAAVGASDKAAAEGLFGSMWGSAQGAKSNLLAR
eukprot:3136673-Pleurochrysis_carterae.AAC.2